MEYSGYEVSVTLTLRETAPKGEYEDPQIAQEPNFLSPVEIGNSTQEKKQASLSSRERHELSGQTKQE